ncbi:hypothetical protein DPMN_071760 [Dreissena polymorpha]|uniref:Uncharacterized protein n=1 Tax=Dreissena polymorpha TaxID=45954 RepID=A0A9D4BPY2_DREPO|nr:hypothetical protein DPMN_071760 [Dreissena polymorpha]
MLTISFVYCSNRTRAVLVSPECGGSLCPMLLDSTDCYVTHVTDCAFTDWSMWTACSTDCGVGVVTRLRVMTTPAYCGGACESAITREESACESYTAKQNCEVLKSRPYLQCFVNSTLGKLYCKQSLMVPTSVN